MNFAQQIETILDPERVHREFMKKEEIKMKLETLKTNVFKNFTIKKSKSVMHPQISHLTPVNEPQKKNDQSSNEPDKITNTIPNVTTIHFGLKKQKRQQPARHAQSLKNLPAFSPKKRGIHLRKTMYQLQSQKKQIEPHPQLHLKRTLSQKIKAMEHRDSQTLLRKNSLFLVSCLKTRYRQTQKKAHIGDVNGVANMKLAFFSQKKLGTTHYQQRFEYMEEARQRLLMAQPFEGNGKRSKLHALFPEPW